jgi:putative transposase
MARISCIVIPGFPHHVMQRGNRRQKVFFESSDYALYRDLLAERCHKASVEVWAYCLMPDHVHLVLTPQTPDGLARAIGETHRRYTGFINARATSGVRRLRRLACGGPDICSRDGSPRWRLMTHT